MPKLKVLFLADKRGWAFHRVADELKKRIADKDIEIDIAFVKEEPEINDEIYDIVYVFFWGERWHKKYVNRKEKVIKEVSSHRWQFEKQYGLHSADEAVIRYMNDAGTLVCTSKKLHDAFKRHHDQVFEYRLGVDSEIFKPTRLKNSGPTVFGWAGNPNDPLKRFDRLKDKMKEFGARFEIATARDRSEMAEFYQGIDVLLISSVAEGTPLPLLEGLASGNFVISTDVGVAGELIREDYLGKIVNFDGADFDDAILWAIRNPDKIRKEVEHRHRFVCEERSWDRAAAELRTILENTHEENSNSLNRREDMRTEPENQYFHHLANVNPDAGSESAYQAAALRFKEDVGAALPREKDSRIIEIGSGFGHFADFLTREGYSRVSILDRDPDLLEFTRRRIGNRLEADFLGDAVEFLEKSDGTYDLIVAFDVIEHMKVQRAIGFLEAARARLEEGGCVIVRTPNMANVLAGYSRYIDLTHETGFTEFSLRHAGQLAGFSESKVLRPKYHGLNRRISNWINSKVHRAIFRIQDRSVPRVFGKNITMLFKK